MKKRIILLAALTAMALLVFSGVSLAATKTNNLNVTAAVQANCNFSSVTDVAFGDYDPTSATPLDVNGDMTFRCTKNTAYETYIVGTRQMVGAVESDNLNFELYTDAGRTTAFLADNSGPTSNAPDNSPITQIIYGRIAALQDVSVDTYSRALTITIEY
ncbi:MAG: spore coat U domain-containing protein [Thermodesulfobacteriota bacterium]